LLKAIASHHQEAAMDAMPATVRSQKAYEGRTRTVPRPLELWCLRGATDDLRGLAVETSFGYALGIELDHELILLHLQPSLEVLVAYADRIESALLAQGWQRPNTQPSSTKERR
jgi:hypothetical protein